MGWIRYEDKSTSATFFLIWHSFSVTFSPPVEIFCFSNVGSFVGDSYFFFKAFDENGALLESGDLQTPGARASLHIPSRRNPINIHTITPISMITFLIF